MIRSAGKALAMFAVASLMILNIFNVRSVASAHDEDTKYTAAQVKISTTIAKSRAHLMASLAVWESGDTNIAATHAGHAKAELLAIADQLKEKQLDTTVSAALTAYSDLAGAAGDKAAIQAANADADKALVAAGDALLGDLVRDAQYRGSVAAELVHMAEHEYEEAYKDGKIVEIIEYQDAKGFIALAQDHYNWAVSLIPSSAGQTEPAAFSVVQAQFDSLAKMFPNFVTPPTEPAAMDVVEAAVDTIMKALSDELHLPVFEQASGNETIDKIKELIADSLMDYEMGHNDDAYEKAASAYLDGFESLETTLGAKDKELMVKLEVQFKDLRDAIKAGTPLADVKKIADDLNANLEKAAELLAS